MKRKRQDWAAILDLREYWTRHAGLLDTQESADHKQLKGRCPFHDDGAASFSASLEKPVWRCFAGCGKGNVVQFHMRARKLAGLPEAEADLLKLAQTLKAVPDSEVGLRHRALLARRDVLDHLKKDRGLDLATVKAYSLGFDGKRIWIPVHEGPVTLLVKQHRWREGTQPKSLTYDPGHAGARLYPEEALKGAEVTIMEGEYKALLALQMGINAVTGTAGAGTWKPEWTPKFRGKTVNICFDTDKAGQDGALKVARMLMGTASVVRVIDLGITSPHKDFGDYVVKLGHGKQDFAQLVESTPEFKPAGTLEEVAEDAPPVDVTLGHASDPENYFRRIRMSVTVSGKDLTPYLAPRHVVLACNMSQGDKCAGCPLSHPEHQGGMEVEFKAGQDILKLVKVSEEDQGKFIRKKVGLPACGAWEWRARDVFRVEELKAIPELTFSDLGNPYVTRTVYSVADRVVRANQSYVFRGITVPEPESQYATQVISEAEPVKTSIESFVMSREVSRRLDHFQVRKGKTVAARVDDICRDLTEHVTQIWQREDIIKAILLTYCSVRGFNFAGKPVPKGWLEALVIGDTRTGKSETLKAIMKEIRLGEFITAENLSFAGLVGGLSQSGNHWHLTWGKLPLNNGGLVGIDEASGISEEVMANLSGLRSSGVAEIIKIENEKTECQTRIVWLSNPRNGRFSSHSYGIHAVRELFGRPEDVARLDMAVSAAEGEVDLGVINSIHKLSEKRKYDSRSLSDLVLWAWSRKPEQVKLTRACEDACMKGAQEFSMKYAPSIPLAEPAEQRIKIARVAAAVAALTFSTEDGEKLLVDREHAEWATEYLDKCFSKPSMGYDLYSLQSIRESHVDPAAVEFLKGQFVGFPKWQVVQRMFLSGLRGVRMRDVEAQTGYEREQLRILFEWLGANDLAHPGSHGFRPSNVFTRILRELQQGKVPRAVGLNQKMKDVKK